MMRNSGLMRRQFVALLGAAPAGLVSVGAAAAPRQLTLALYYPSGTLQAKGARVLADSIARATAGTLEIFIERPPIMMPLDAVGRLSALAVYCAPCVAKSEPVLDLSALPMLASTFDDAAVLDRIARPYYDAALARHGQVVLGTAPWLSCGLWSTFRIRSVADLKGVPFALVASPAAAADAETGWARPFIRLGARSAFYNDAEVVIASGYSGHNMKLAQQFAYFTELFFAAHMTFLTAQRGAFDSLSEVERRALLDAGAATERAMWKLETEQPAVRQQEVTARGVRVVAEAPADVLAALREAAEPDIQAWAQFVGADGATILADYRRSIGRS